MLPIKVCKSCVGSGLDIGFLAQVYRIIDCNKCKGTGYITWIDEIMRPETKDDKNENSMAMDRT